MSTQNQTQSSAFSRFLVVSVIVHALLFLLYPVWQESGLTGLSTPQREGIATLVLAEQPRLRENPAPVQKDSPTEQSRTETLRPIDVPAAPRPTPQSRPMPKVEIPPPAVVAPLPPVTVTETPRPVREPVAEPVQTPPVQEEPKPVPIMTVPASDVVVPAVTPAPQVSDTKPEVIAPAVTPPAEILTEDPVEDVAPVLPEVEEVEEAMAPPEPVREVPPPPSGASMWHGTGARLGVVPKVATDRGFTGVVQVVTLIRVDPDGSLSLVSVENATDLTEQQMTWFVDDWILRAIDFHNRQIQRIPLRPEEQPYLIDAGFIFDAVQDAITIQLGPSPIRYVEEGAPRE